MTGKVTNLSVEILFSINARLQVNSLFFFTNYFLLSRGSINQKNFFVLGILTEEESSSLQVGISGKRFFNPSVNILLAT